MVSRRRRVGDKGEYEPLEAEAVDDDEAACAEAEEFDDVTADLPLDERIESASPDEVGIPTPYGDDLEEIVSERPETERVPPENLDQPIIRAPDDEQPTTQDYVPGDIDSEGDWPDE